MTIPVFLLLLLFIGFGFLFFYPIKPILKQKGILKAEIYLTANIRTIIIFVVPPNLDKNETIENQLAYQVVSNMAGEKHERKMVWLLHGFGLGEQDPSYLSASLIDERFRSTTIKLQLVGVNIYDLEDVFNKVNQILASVNSKIIEDTIVCDCTAGPKPVTLGIALASLQNQIGRLVYFQADNSRYREFDTTFLKLAADLQTNK
jgi:hypothetical protein